MLSNGLEPHTIHISNQLIRSVATTRQKYQTFLESSREEKRSKKINDQKSIVTKKLEEVILKRDQLNKVCGSLEADFVLAVQNAEKKMDLSFVSKANALKRKANETKQDLEKLEETIFFLQEKRKKIFYDHTNYNYHNYFHVLIFCCETDSISFTTQETITCSESGKETLKQCQKL